MFDEPQGELIDTGPSPRGWHRLETALHCLQQYSFKFNLGLIDYSPPLVRGTLGHVGLAHFYTRLMLQQQGKPFEHLLEPLAAVDEKAKRMDAEAAKRATPPVAEPHVEKVKDALRYYIREYGAEPHQIVAVEHLVEMQLGGHLVTQRLDLVTVDARGKFYGIDHKFVSVVRKGIVKRYRLSGQFMMLEHQMRNRFGRDNYGGYRINFIGVEKLDVLRETPDPRPFAYDRFPETVAAGEWLIQNAAHLDPWHYPKVFSEQVCDQGVYGPCSFAELCAWGKPSVGQGA